MSEGNITENGVQVGFVMDKKTRDYIREYANEQSRSFSAQLRIILSEWVESIDSPEIDQPGPEL